MRGDGDAKPQKPGLDQEVERGSSTVGSVWKTVTIAVDGSSTAFEIYQRDDDDWMAVGQAPDADLTLQSHGVPWIPLKLVRNTDLSDSRAERGASNDRRRHLVSTPRMSMTLKPFPTR